MSDLIVESDELEKSCATSVNTPGKKLYTGWVQKNGPPIVIE